MICKKFPELFSRSRTSTSIPGGELLLEAAGKLALTYNSNSVFSNLFPEPEETEDDYELKHEAWENANKFFTIYRNNHGFVEDVDSIKQAENPYSATTTYMTSITIPTATAISGWTFLGYKAGSNSATSGTTFAASQAGSAVTPEYNVYRTNRGLYSRIVTISYNANGGDRKSVV